MAGHTPTPQHSPLPWTVDAEDRPYLRDANGTIVMKFYRATIGTPIPWEANVALLQAALADHAALLAKVAALEAEMWELLHSATSHLHAIGQTSQQVDETPWVKRARAALALAKDA